MGANVISFEASGSDKTEKFLTKLGSGDLYNSLGRFAQEGVNALAAATPVDSGATANAWSYRITKTRGGVTIEWTNGNKVNGVPVAILLQYGHGTGTGGYVRGRDFINPAMRPIFDKIADEVWRAVTRA